MGRLGVPPSAPGEGLGHREPGKEARIADSTRETWHAPDGYDDRLDHFRNFFAAVRSRQPVVEDALFGLRAAAPSLLCNLSYEKQLTPGGVAVPVR
ncbi:MAG TPA: hypothetical protein VEQ10_16200 [Vicinamibacteria bacterium]|nr:hypothetical protein [Vicinamibacteria bacterium]